jgi:hypothetical protein
MMKNYLASRIGINTTVDNYEGNWGLPGDFKYFLVQITLYCCTEQPT